MAKKLYDAMVQDLENVLDNFTFDLISVTDSSKKNEDGTEEKFTKVELEIPKGCSAFSRCRFSCKLPLTNLNISEDDLDNGVLVSIKGIKITYISAQKEIYTKADFIEIL